MGMGGGGKGGVPHKTSPSISCTFFFHLTPESSSHNFTFKTLLAMDSASCWESSLPIAANMSRPLLIVDISWPSTVTEADFTRCITAAGY